LYPTAQNIIEAVNLAHMAPWDDWNTVDDVDDEELQDLSVRRIVFAPGAHL
jgi:hypothetical protein